MDLVNIELHRKKFVSLQTVDGPYNTIQLQAPYCSAVRSLSLVNQLMGANFASDTTPYLGAPFCLPSYGHRSNFNRNGWPSICVVRSKSLIHIIILMF
jgi:hypothetical protein